MPTTTIIYKVSDEQVEQLKNDPNIYRSYLRKINKSDKEIMAAYQEYTNVRDFIQRKKFRN